MPNYKRRNKPRNIQKKFLIVEGPLDKIFFQHILSILNKDKDVIIRHDKGCNRIPGVVSNLRKTYSEHEIYAFVDLDNSKSVNNIYKDITDLAGTKSIDIDEIHYVQPFLEYLLVLSKKYSTKNSTNKNGYNKDISQLFGLTYNKSQLSMEQLLNTFTQNELQTLLGNITVLKRNKFDRTDFDELIQKL